MNGGLDQWLWNPTGAFVTETLRALERVGATVSADIVRAVIQMFPHQQIARDLLERREQLKMVISQQGERLEQLSDIYGGEGGRENGKIFELLYEYLADHKGDGTNPTGTTSQ